MIIVFCVDDGSNNRWHPDQVEYALDGTHLAEQYDLDKLDKTPEFEAQLREIIEENL